MALRYPRSFKLKIVKEVVMNEEQKGIQSKVAAKYGVSNYAISNWVKTFRDEVELPKDKKNIESKDNEISLDKIKKENEVLRAILIQKEFEIKQLRTN